MVFGDMLQISFLMSLIFHTGEFHRDSGDAFDPPSAGSEPGASGRQWSSLKSSGSPPTAREEDRERTKSLPAYGSTNQFCNCLCLVLNATIITIHSYFWSHQKLIL